VPDIEQLFELPLAGTAMSPVWAGTGTLVFGDAPDEELPALGALQVTGGYLYQRGWTTAPVAKLLHDYRHDAAARPSAAE
jgi:hypothetical protein